MAAVPISSPPTYIVHAVEKTNTAQATQESGTRCARGAACSSIPSSIAKLRIALSTTSSVLCWAHKYVFLRARLINFYFEMGARIFKCSYCWKCNSATLEQNFNRKFLHLQALCQRKYVLLDQ